MRTLRDYQLKLMLKVDLTGEKFKQVLKEAGITQREFAKTHDEFYTGVNRQLNKNSDKLVPPDYLYTLVTKFPEYKILIALIRLGLVDKKEIKLDNENQK